MNIDLKTGKIDMNCSNEKMNEVKSTIKKGKGQRDTTQKFISAAQMTVMVQTHFPLQEQSGDIQLFLLRCQMRHREDRIKNL